MDAAAAGGMLEDQKTRSNVIRLGIAQALSGANSAVMFATGSIVGSTLAPARTDGGLLHAGDPSGLA